VTLQDVTVTIIKVMGTPMMYQPSVYVI